MKKICVQCQKEFELTDSEISFYKSKGLSLPKRCKQCRELNKQKNSTHEKTNNFSLIGESHATDKLGKNIKPVHILISVGVFVVFAIFMYFLSNFPNSNKIQNYEYSNQYEYNFANENLLVEHFNKHGHEFGYSSKEDYLKGAINIIKNPNAQTRIQDDGDTCYYLQVTDEFVVVSPDGNIRTYFRPGDGNSEEGYEYFLRQQIVPFSFLLAS